MNEQTKIELLKIAAELTVATINKTGTQFTGYTPKEQHPNVVTLFGECVKAAHDQYQQLTKGIETGQ
ncbi:MULTISPECIES: hypothetical protein [Methylobacter]